MSVTDWKKQKLWRVMETLDSYIDERISWAAANKEWANPDRLMEAHDKFEAALADVLDLPK